MISAPARTPDGLEIERLTKPVRRALDMPEANVLEWRCAPLTWAPIASTTAGLFRVDGVAADGRDRRQWTLVLKVIKQADGASEDPGAPGYWRREPDAFESGALEDLAGLSAPRWYGSAEVDTGAGKTVWLWLEHVEEPEPSWTRARYAVAARDLGEFNGSYLSTRPLPSANWLTRGWLRWWIEGVGPRTRKVVSDAETWRIPLVRRAFPVAPAERILTLADRAPRLLAALEAAAPTLSHQDAWRTNLLAARAPDGTDRTVLLDWSFVGLAPAGVDAAILMTGSHFWLHADPTEIELFDDDVFAAYLDGLERAGARASRNAVRLAYAATAALWGGLTAPLWLPRWGDPQRREWLEAKFGRSLEDAVEPYARALGFMLDLGDEAWALLDSRS
jgi:hypothetical protein